MTCLVLDTRPTENVDERHIDMFQFAVNVGDS